MPNIRGKSAVSRNQATSPPKELVNHQSQSIRRTRARSTRSQSIDVVRETTSGPSLKRRTRQGSAGSIDSNVSATSRDGRKKKPSRAATRHLSIVTEDREELADEHKGNNGNNSGEEKMPKELRSKRSFSDVSQMTATTAWSNATSITTKELASIDPEAAETLSELYNASREILGLLAPPNTSKTLVESIRKDIKNPGSKRGKILKKEEDVLKAVGALFGSTDAKTYIQLRLVIQKLLGTNTPDNGLFRPDEVIYTANMAVMVKEILVHEQGSSDGRTALERLQDFPRPFLTSFSTDGEIGESSLLDESFSLCLEIRTQVTIAALRRVTQKGEDFQPDDYLITEFFDEQDTVKSMSDNFDILENGLLKGLPGRPSLSKDQIATARKRVTDIRSAFREMGNTYEAGELVDIGLLERMFPWIDFLAQLVSWSQARVLETSRFINDNQGGVDVVQQELIHKIQNTSNEVGISQNSVNTMENIALLQILRRGTSIIRTPSASHQPTPSKLEGKQTQAEVQSPEIVVDFKLPDRFSGEDEEVLRHNSDHSTARYTSIVEDWGRERNKENRPGTQASILQAGTKKAKTTSKSRTHDRPTPVEAARLSDQKSAAGLSRHKRSRQTDLEEELSEDEGFEGDQRVPDRSRRKGLPSVRSKSPASGEYRPSKRPRAASEDAQEDLPPDLSHRRSRTIQRPKLRNYDQHEESEGDEGPAPTYSELNEAALRQSARARVPEHRTQKRIPWSDKDVSYLTEGIEEYGCKWSRLWRLDGWEVPRDQVALKDKARNLVVRYHQLGAPLPINFDQVAIGKKEIASIQRVRPGWQPPS